jgi:hypothetical protein
VSQKRRTSNGWQKEPRRHQRIHSQSTTVKWMLFGAVECQRIPLAFANVLPLIVKELAKGNHHSYLIKERF